MSVGPTPVGVALPVAGGLKLRDTVGERETLGLRDPVEANTALGVTEGVPRPPAPTTVGVGGSTETLRVGEGVRERGPNMSTMDTGVAAA